MIKKSLRCKCGGLVDYQPWPPGRHVLKCIGTDLLGCGRRVVAGKKQVAWKMWRTGDKRGPESLRRP